MTTKRQRSSPAQASADAGPSEPRFELTHEPQTGPKSKSKQYSPTGVAAAARIAALQPNRDHVSEWEHAASFYGAMLEAKGGARLVELDRRREEVAEGWTAKSGISKEQFLNVVVEWKFAKMKFRHALKLLRSNSEEAVAAASRRAFTFADLIPHDRNNGADGGGRDVWVSHAIDELCELKAVGPATASAVLCLYRPDAFAFMDDEVVECLHGGKRARSLKVYVEVNGRCREIAAELNEAVKGGGSESSEWTPYSVGKALWTALTMSATAADEGLTAAFKDGGEMNETSQKKAKKG